MKTAFTRIVETDQVTTPTVRLVDVTVTTVVLVSLDCAMVIVTIEYTQN